jgi:hypothetical protein
MGNDINDDRLVEGRQKIIDGEVLPVCQEKCLDIEHLFASQRQDLNKRWPIKNPVAAKANPEHIEYIDLRMGNICNYMCLMCGERDSHLWGKANNKENPYISWAKDPVQYERIMDFIASCKNLKCISLAGGEPFYNKKQLFDVIDRLDRNIELKFITNMSFCDDEIVAKLNEFKTGRMHCSIDGVGKWVETQRYRSDWQTIESNTLKFARELHEGWQMMLVPTFTVLNTFGLAEFVDWIFNVYRKTRPTANFSYTVCTMPQHMTMYNIPLQKRKEIAQTIRDKGYEYPILPKLLASVEKDIEPDDKTVKQLDRYLSYVKHSTDFDVLQPMPEVGEVIGKTKLDPWKKNIV